MPGAIGDFYKAQHNRYFNKNSHYSCKGGPGGEAEQTDSDSDGQLKKITGSD